MTVSGGPVLERKYSTGGIPAGRFRLRDGHHIRVERAGSDVVVGVSVDFDAPAFALLGTRLLPDDDFAHAQVEVGLETLTREGPASGLASWLSSTPSPDMIRIDQDNVSVVWRRALVGGERPEVSVASERWSTVRQVLAIIGVDLPERLDELLTQIE